MTEIFKMALSMSLSGAVLIIVVFLFNRLLGKRLSKRWQYYIWLVVVLRLLIPVTSENSLVGNLFNGEIPSIFGHIEERQSSQSNVDQLLINSDESENVSAITDSPPKSPAGQQSNMAAKALMDFLWILWLVIALVLLIRKVTLYQSFSQYIKAGKSEVSNPDTLNRFAEACEQAGVRRLIELYTNNLIASPLLMGICKPCVVLPHLSEDEMEFRYICLHEATHYKRGDIYYKWLLQITLCLHWFNPLVHLMVREAGRNCELSCDEAVLRSLSEDERKQYGDTLLESLKTPGTYREKLAALTLSENASLLKERLAAIKNFGGNKKKMVFITVLLSVCLFTGGYLLGAYTTKPIAPTDAENMGFTEDGLPIMSTKNQEIYNLYLRKMAVTGLFRRDFTPEDIAGLAPYASDQLLVLVDALENEKMIEYSGAVPASFAEEVLTTYFPINHFQILETCADIYDANTDTYRYESGLGGGPAEPIVTSSERSGDLLTIYYTWFIGDPGAEAFHYAAQDSGKLVIDLSGHTFKYLSNTVIEKNSSIALFASSEKAQTAEEQLINRLQAIINELDSVSDTVISITTSEETGKEVVVSITSEKNKPLTDKQKESIINIIAASVGDLEADNIHITET